MKTKAQSALEYMMTYGWAILIIVIVAAVLYSLGIFSPSSSVGTTATGFSPFTVLAQTCTPHYLAFQLGNNAGVTVTLKNVFLTTSSGITASTAILADTSSVVTGGSTTVNFSSGEACVSGARYSASITVAYTESNNLGLQTLNASGTLSGSAS